MGAGALLGALDAIGFYWTAGLFIGAGGGSKKIAAGIFEFGRLAALIVIVFLLCSVKSISIIPLLACALLVTLGGKMLLIFKKLKA